MTPVSDIPLNDVVRYAVAAVFILSILIALAYSIWGGLLLITSGGSEEKVKPAVNHIRHALIGLIVMMIVLFSVPLISQILGLPYPDSARPQEIFTTIRELSSRFFDPSSTSIDYSTSSSSSSVGDNFTDL